MKQTEIKDIKIKLTKYLKDNPDLNFTDLASLIFKDDDSLINNLSNRTIRGYLSMLKKEIELDDENTDKDVSKDSISDISTSQLEIDFSEIPNHPDAILEHIDDLTDIDNSTDIAIHYAGDSFSIDEALLDKVFCAYSKKGLNLSGPMVKNAFGIEDKLFRAIVSKMGLNKESNPYSPNTERKLEPSLLHEYVTSLVPTVLDIYMKNDGSVVTQLSKLHKESIIKYQNQELYIKAQMEELKELLPTVRVEKLKSSIDSLQNNDEILHVIIGDMHIGLNQPNYTKKIVEAQLAIILESINSCLASGVHVHFMGDIIHSVTGLNHPDSWKSIDHDDHGANAIINPYKILLNFLSSIINLDKVTIVGGNHDRMSDDKKVENTGEGAKLIAFMLDESLKNVDVQFDSNMIIDNDDPSIRIINLHGDNPIDKESGQRIAWEFGDKSKFNLISTAHLHSRKQDPKDDGLTFRKQQVTAFCPIDSYGKTVAHGSLPGVQLITTTPNGLPIIIDFPLHYD